MRIAVRNAFTSAGCAVTIDICAGFAYKHSVTIDTEELRRAAESRLAAAKAEYGAEIRHIESIENIAQRASPTVASGNCPPLRRSRRSGFRNKTSDPAWPGFRRAILLLASERTQGFSADDAREYIEQKYPVAAKEINMSKVSTQLSAMYTRTKELRKLVAGSGSTSGVYVLTHVV